MQDRINEGGLVWVVRQLQQCADDPLYIYMHPASLADGDLVRVPNGTTLVLDKRLPLGAFYITGTKIEWAE